MDYDEDPDYLDLDDILAHSQRVMCTFLLDIPNLGFLSPQLDEGTQGQKVLLPFWMAKVLYSQSMIDIEIPDAYSERKREQSEIDSELANLHKDGPYFYRFGQLILKLRREKGNNLPEFLEDGQRNKYRREEGETLNDRREIAAYLLETFHHRRSKILPFTINRSMEDSSQVSNFELRLDNTERSLFRNERQIISELKRWDSKNSDLISNSQIAQRLSKRLKTSSSSGESKRPDDNNTNK